MTLPIEPPTQTISGLAILDFWHNPQSKLFPYQGYVVDDGKHHSLQWQPSGECGSKFHANHHPEYDFEIIEEVEE